MRFLHEIERAGQRIDSLVRSTYLEYSPAFSAQLDCDVWFKLENLQHTGSFKYRGASNRIRAASADELEAGFVTASTGNHGAAFAKAARIAGCTGIIFVPENAARSKLENIAQYDADIRQFGDDGVVTEAHARHFAEQHGMTYVSPYNDPLVAAGQGTIGIELVAQLDAPADVVFVALGGGGLIGGIGCYLKAHWPGVSIVACSPQHSCVMHESVKAGKILDIPSLPTLSDGTAGGVEAGAITFDFVRAFVDDFELATEAEIAAAMRLYISRCHQLIEGAAGVAIAALLKRRAALVGQRVVVVICGGNVGVETLKAIL